MGGCSRTGTHSRYLLPALAVLSKSIVFFGNLPQAADDRRADSKHHESRMARLSHKLAAHRELGLPAHARQTGPVLRAI
jgi:hypothetical protein